MMHNFITDVRKGGDLLKSFEQSDLLNNMCPSRTNCKKDKVQRLHMQIVCMS